MPKHVPERTCIVTRTAGPASGLMRFARGPDGSVVADLRGRLPGRGAWVSPTASAVALAAKKRLFARALKAEVTVSPMLVAEVDAALRRDLLGALGLANKAGAVVAGFAKVEAALAAGRVALLVHAREATPDGRRKLANARVAAERTAASDPLRNAGPEPISAVSTFDDLSSVDLDVALGRVHVIHAALLAGAGSQGCLRSWRRLRLYRGLDDEAALLRDVDHRLGRPAGPETGRTDAV